MRTIDYTKQFKKDFEREKKSGVYAKKLDDLLREAVDFLVADKPLPKRYFDHQLSGEWRDFCDCHVRPDLVLLYRKIGDDRLELVRLGSHNQLGL